MDILVQETVTIIAVLALGGWIAWLASRHAGRIAEARRDRARTLAEIVARLPSAEAALEFLRSPEGRSLIAEPATRRGARTAVAALVGGAAAALALGYGLLANARRYVDAVDPNLTLRRDDALWWAYMLLPLGVALLVAAGVLHRLGAPPGAGSNSGGNRSRDE